MIDAYDLTDSQLSDLRREAIAAGDLDMAHLCVVARGGEETATQSQIQAARTKCAEAISAAAAMID